MSWIESQAHTWLATHMCTHAHMSTHVSTHTYTSQASVDPLWGQEHQCPCGFLPYGIMLGRYFCLLGWLLDMVFIWIGNLFSFESICSKEKRGGWLRSGAAIRSAHRSVLTWRTWADNGRLEEVEGRKSVSSYHGRLHLELYIQKRNIITIKVIIHHKNLFFISALDVLIWRIFFLILAFLYGKRLIPKMQPLHFCWQPVEVHSWKHQNYLKTSIQNSQQLRVT